MDQLKFWDFGIVDFIDAFLVAILLYYVYKLIKGTVAINIFIGIIIIYFVWKLTTFLKMGLLRSIFSGFMEVGIIALKTEGQIQTDVDVIISACQKMGSTRTGALIVLERNNNLDFLTSSGDAMNIAVTQPIIESIFFKNSPLHDGAIVIAENTVKATRVILPVSSERNIPQRFGLRHRAAVGITEKTDALAIAVSEETGQISYIKNGEFVMFKDNAELIAMIKKDLT